MQLVSVPLDAQSILNCLHVNSWFSVGAQSCVVDTALGGRQGCKFGGVIFGAFYEDCVTMVRRRHAMVAPTSPCCCVLARSGTCTGCEDTTIHLDKPVEVHHVQFADDSVSLLFAWTRSSNLASMASSLAPSCSMRW